MAPHRLIHPDLVLTELYELTEAEVADGTVARTRAQKLVDRRELRVVGLAPGDLSIGSFLVLGLWRTGAPYGLGLWGMGVRCSGRVDSARWHCFHLTHADTAVNKRTVRTALRRRLLMFPAGVHGIRVTDVREVVARRAELVRRE